MLQYAFAYEARKENYAEMRSDVIRENSIRQIGSPTSTIAGIMQQRILEKMTLTEWITQMAPKQDAFEQAAVASSYRKYEYT